MDRISRTDLVKTFQNNFKEKFHEKNFITSSAPGRINLIGEHTDYNNGYAMPFGIDRWICTVISKRTDNKIILFSHNYDIEIKTDIDFDLSFQETWKKYIFGCIKLFIEKHPSETGYNILIGGNIPIGYGLSSSAALEVSLLGALYKISNIQIDIEILNIAKKVENEIIKINSGFLDQYASLESKKNKILFIDFKTKTHKLFNFQLENASLLLIKSSSNRLLAESGYNKRVKECSDGLKIINSKLLNNVENHELKLDHLNLLEENMTLQKRLKHLIRENMRVKAMINALNDNNINLVGELLYESHKSLSMDYEVSTSEIDSIIDISKSLKGFLGGRIVGGGFGGCCLVLIENEFKKSFKSTLIEIFSKKYGYELSIELFKSCSGLAIN